MAAAENTAEVAALRGWRVYFNTLTIAGRRNVSDTRTPSGSSTSYPSSLSPPVGHWYLDSYSGNSMAEQEEETAQGSQSSSGLKHSTHIP